MTVQVKVKPRGAVTSVDVVQPGLKGPKGDDKVYVGLTPPNPRGTYEVWVKAQPPT